jgi:two-component system nitrogen regulation sensor histidine kinase NtrY
VSLWRVLGAVAALLVVAALVFEVCVRQLTGGWLTFGTHPEVIHQLELSLADQKRLAALDPAHTAVYRRRFAAAESLLGRLRILAYNREEIAGRYRAALLLVFACLAALAVAAFLVARARQQRRLDRLRAALARLAAGDTDISLGRRRRDLLGRLAGMVEETSRTMARDRRRLASLENLAAWQEAARRHAHEIRTPLTAAHLELGRLDRLLEDGDDAGDDAAGHRLRQCRQLAESVRQELDRLRRFTSAFASFGRLPQPRLQPVELAAFVAEFAAAFASGWPNLALVFAPPAAPGGGAPGTEPGAPAGHAATRPRVQLAPGRGALPRPAACIAACDRDLLRQVLVNLCDNSALALGGGGRRGTVRFGLAAGDGWLVLTVADDGPGIAAAVLPRLFEPYATTRRVGEGLGLGLAISRKILLDHGGDLELAGSSAAGSSFRLLLPAAGSTDAGSTEAAGDFPQSEGDS